MLHDLSVYASEVYFFSGLGFCDFRFSGLTLSVGFVGWIQVAAVLISAASAMEVAQGRSERGQKAMTVCSCFPRMGGRIAFVSTKISPHVRTDLRKANC